jgi:prepilin-type N-terminal cleavage/methylation domain-containing protein
LFLKGALFLNRRIAKVHKGVTLIELMVVILIFALILSITFNTLLFGNRVFASGDTQFDIQSNIRLASDSIREKVRYVTDLSVIGSFDPATADSNFNYIYLSGDKKSIKLKEGANSPVNIINAGSGDVEFDIQFTRGSSVGNAIKYSNSVSAMSITNNNLEYSIYGKSDSKNKEYNVSTDIALVNLNTILPDFNYVEAPIASPIDGVIGSGVPVTLSQADGAEIFYTIDGSTPTTGSLKYTSPICIFDHTIIKAIAVKNGISSIVVVYEYTIDDFPPSASNVVISPNPKSGYSVGDTLTVTYAYTSPAGRSQGSSKINWYRLSERDGARTNIIKEGINDGGVGLTYEVVGADSGYYICVEIIPIDSEGVQGEPVWEVSTKTVIN